MNEATISRSTSTRLILWMTSRHKPTFNTHMSDTLCECVPFQRDYFVIVFVFARSLIDDACQWREIRLIIYILIFIHYACSCSFSVSHFLSLFRTVNNEIHSRGFAQKNGKVDLVVLFACIDFGCKKHSRSTEKKRQIYGQFCVDCFGFFVKFCCFLESMQNLSWVLAFADKTKNIFNIFCCILMFHGIVFFRLRRRLTSHILLAAEYFFFAIRW